MSLMAIIIFSNGRQNHQYGKYKNAVLNSPASKVLCMADKINEMHKQFYTILVYLPVFSHPFLAEAVLTVLGIDMTPRVGFTLS